MADDALAVRFLAQVADLDGLVAFLAPGIERDHFADIPSRTASLL